MGQQIYITAANLLLSRKKIIFARTIRRAGSTPRDVGSMCIITEDNQIIGTVGGGLLEYKVHKKAMTLFKKGHSFIYEFKLSNDDLAKAGMICGGNVDLFLEPLFPDNPATMSIFKTIAKQIKNNKPATLVSRIENNLDAMAEDTRLLILEDGATKGALPGPNTENLDTQNLTTKNPDEANPDTADQAANKMATTSDSPYQLIETDGGRTHLFIERLQLRPRIFLFGAGHVSTCVAQVAKLVDFDITVIDDRPEFANKERFPDADTICVADFKQAFEDLTISGNAYILIITRGHMHDKAVLEFALETKAAYIGMIGSVKKRNIIYKSLMENGMSKKRLEKVYSPIGTDINAETPEEIAVSIVGELIKKRAPAKKQKNLIL